MKILYDDSKKRNIDTGLEETNTKLANAVNYAEGISVPYGFGRKGDIQTRLSTLRSSKNIVGQAQSWITKTNNDFNSKSEAIKSRLSKIENKKIVKKDLLIK
jgi:hypothetical protein